MKVLSKFYDLYKRLNATASRLEKEKILGGFADDAEVKAVLHFIFNPFIVTGISDKKLSKKNCKTTETADAGLLSVLDYFTAHNTGRDEDIIYLNKYLNSKEERFRPVAADILV